MSHNLANRYTVFQYRGWPLVQVDALGYARPLCSLGTGRAQLRVLDDARRLFRYFDVLELAREQRAFVATPEKALLDLLYLTPDSDSVWYLRELRLTAPDTLGREAFLQRLQTMAGETAVGKLQRAVEHLGGILQ